MPVHLGPFDQAMSPQELKSIMSSGLLSFPLTDFKPADLEQLNGLIGKLGPQ